MINGTGWTPDSNKAIKKAEERTIPFTPSFFSLFLFSIIVEDEEVQEETDQEVHQEGIDREVQEGIEVQEEKERERREGLVVLVGIGLAALDEIEMNEGNPFVISFHLIMHLIFFNSIILMIYCSDRRR